MDRRDLLKGLTKEQLKKAKACKNSEELLALAKEEGIELTSEQLEAISGGGCFFDAIDHPMCPNCFCSDEVDNIDEYNAYCNRCDLYFDAYWEVN